MSLTRDEISDLNSFISRLIETEKTLILAEQAKQEAYRQLQSFLYNQSKEQATPVK